MQSLETDFLLHWKVRNCFERYFEHQDCFMGKIQFTGVARHGFLDIRESYRIYKTFSAFIEGCALSQVLFSGLKVIFSFWF